MKYLNVLAVSLALLFVSTFAYSMPGAKLSAGTNHTLAIDLDGNVIAAGGSRAGQTGPFALDQFLTYQGMAPIHVGIKADMVVGTGNRSLAVRSDGTVMFWGMLGPQGSYAASPTPTTVPGLTNIVDAAMSFYAAYFVDANGVLYSWDFGSAPVVVATATAITQVNSGDASMFAIDVNGDLYAWGRNTNGELGLGDTVDRATPTLVLGLANVVDVDTSQNHTVVALADGRAFAMGYNKYGKLGNVTADGANYTTPVQVMNIPTNVVSVGVHMAGSVALMSDGTVWTWGWSNYNGQAWTVGTPAMITELSEVVQLDGSRNSVHFLDVYGTRTGFISNMNGMLGDGTNTERHAPVAALDTTGVENIEVAAVAEPLVASIEPGGSYIIVGENFGETEGTVAIDGMDLVLISWNNNEIHIENPLEQVTGYLVVTTVDGLDSNATLVTLEPDAPAATEIEEELVVEEPAEEAPALNCKPGYGYGDKNHCHSGPPGLAKGKGKGKK